MFAPVQPTEVIPGVWLFTSSLYATTSTVIRSSQHVLIVDPNWLPGEVNAIRSFVHGISGNRKHILFFTHSDYDHIIGYGAFPGARVIASQAFAESQHKAEDLAQAIAFDREHDLVRDYPITYPVVDNCISGYGEQLQLDEITLVFYPAKGHTEEGIFTIMEPHGIWIAGDYLSDVEFPLISDIRAYRKTMDLVEEILASHHIRWMIPGHGTLSGGRTEILRRRDASLQYLEDLERHLRGEAFPEEQYRARYPNWEALLPWHRDNIETLRREKEQQ